jgi:hypothetical protein
MDVIPRERRGSLKERGIKPGASWCEHNYPILVSPTETDSYHARCLACLEVGPECTSAEAARQALLVTPSRA